ncbi:hypothetical protein KM043_003405 [Ampulex compressa]|nr:hypothetical protein KM043_003405 [Ampulex compressa]
MHWVDDLFAMMDRFSLSRNYSVESSGSKSCLEPIESKDIIEITDDESDSETDLKELKIQKRVSNSAKSLPVSSKISDDDVLVPVLSKIDCKKLSGEEHSTLSSDSEGECKDDKDKFEKSTDSLESDEDIGNSTSHMQEFVKPRTSLFDWNFGNSNKSKPKQTTIYRNVTHNSSETRWTPRDFRRNEEPQLKKQKVYDDVEIPKPIVDKIENEPVAEVMIQHEITVAGTKVKLPIKPYPCQIAVMNMLIQGCTKEQNCLLESPTGSGKTLALLCGVLAWQEQYRGE